MFDIYKKKARDEYICPTTSSINFYDCWPPCCLESKEVRIFHLKRDWQAVGFWCSCPSSTRPHDGCALPTGLVVVLGLTRLVVLDAKHRTKMFGSMGWNVAAGMHSLWPVLGSYSCIGDSRRADLALAKVAPPPSPSQSDSLQAM